MNKKQINNILIWFSAIVLIILIMTPGLWVVLTAFRPQVDVMAKPAVWIPRNLNLIQFETNAYSFHEIKNANIPADAIPDRDSGNSICQKA
jgi:ABC-type glycerol-3-phosphate transport system permease component